MANRLLGSGAEAEDTLQDVFLKMWSIRGELNDYRNPEALAMRMTRNQCLDRLKRKPLMTSIKEEEPSRSIGDTPVHQLEGEELKRHINHLIERLPEQQRTVIQLRDIEGYSFDEMEAVTDLSHNALRVNLSRARKTLRAELQKLYAYGT